MILQLYFARRFLLNLLVITTVLMAMVMLVDLIDQTRRFGDQGVTFGQRLVLTLLNAPATMSQILPLIMILATVALFGALARSSELVVVRAAGRSAARAVLAPMAVALLVGVLAILMLGPIVAATSKRYVALTELYRADGVSALSVSQNGLWLRQGRVGRQTVIRAGRSNTDASVLYEVTFVAFGPNGRPITRIEAESAAIQNGEWSLRNAKVWPLDTAGNPEVNATTHDTLAVPSNLTLDRIRESLGTPTGVSIWDMPTLIKQLEQAGFSARRHHVWLQSQLAQPVFLMGMVLVAAAFTMRHIRFGGTGTAVLAAVLLGFGLYFIRSFAQILGENGQIPVMLAAWAPPLAANLLAAGLLLQAEDG